MQYNELNINITLKPVNELYVIKEVDSSLNYMNYVKPSPNNDNHEFYRFLVSPPEHDKGDYTYKREMNLQKKIIGFLFIVENKNIIQFIKKIYDLGRKNIFYFIYIHQNLNKTQNQIISQQQ